MKRALVVAVCLAFASVVQAKAPKTKVNPPRRVVVAAFEAPPESRARNAVLATLSEHPDVEVVALADVEFTSKRFKADPATPDGRKKIATELGIDGWIDGRVQGLDAHMKLSSASGRRVAEADAHGATDSLMEAVAGEKMWAAFGAALSDREKRRRTLLSNAELARQKIADRQHELDRQRTLALEREDRRLERLKDERDLARRKQAAVLQEQARQEKLVQDRIAQDTKEREESEERRRRAEMRRLAQAPMPGYGAPSRRSSWNAPTSGGYGAGSQGAYASGYGAAPAQPDTAMTQPSASGVTSNTQRWLENQGQAPAAPAGGGNGSAPGTGSSTPAPGIETVGGGVSPATQRWLEQQQMR